MDSKKIKARNFAFILYPESIPDDWKDRLESLGICMAVSPLHDKDKSTVEGQEFKKPHYHVLYIAKNPVTVESIRIKIKRCLGDKTVNHVEIVDNIENAYLYLTHESKDAVRKGKHVYPKDDITLLNDFDIDRYIVLDDAQKKDLRYALFNLIHDEHIVNAAHLRYYISTHPECVSVNQRVVEEVISHSVAYFKLQFDAEYQMGYRYVSGSDKVVNKETGEIVK